MVAAIDSTVFGFRYGGKVIDPQRSNLDTVDAERIDRYRQYWNLYKGDHWDNPRGDGNPDESVVTLNLAKRIIDISAFFLMKRGWDITIPDDPDTGQNESEDQKFKKQALDAVWRKNKKSLISFEMAQLGGVTGDLFVRVRWKPEDPLEGPHPRIEPLPSQYVYPEYGGETGLDNREMTRCSIVWPKIVEITERRRLREPRTKNQIVWYKEVWTKDTVQTWRDDELLEQNDNVFGMIPIVHIRNFPLAGESFGISDLAPIIDLQKELNEKSTDVSDVIDYHGSPITVVIGAKVQQLERGANRVWGLPPGSDIKNLELKGDMKASMDYINLIRSSMFELTGTPPLSLAGPEHVSGSSGATISQAYSPLTEIRDVKTELYGTGIREINVLLLKILLLKDAKFASKMKDIDPDIRYKTEIAWAEPFRRDESIALTQTRSRLDMKMTTRKRELIRMGHGEADADRIVEEADEEAEKFAKLDLSFGSLMNQPKRSGNPNPVKPNQDSQGEKVSIQAEMPSGDDDDA